MTKLMLEGNKDESDDKENRKGNRRETWAPGLAGTHVLPHGRLCNCCSACCAPFSIHYAACTASRVKQVSLYASCCTLTELILYASGVYFAQLKCIALSAIICAHLNHVSGVMKLLTIEPNVQDSVTGRELFRPRLRTALWKRQSHQLAVSLNQRLSLPCPWGWRLSRLHPSAARAWQVHISTVCHACNLAGDTVFSMTVLMQCWTMLPSLAATNLACSSNAPDRIVIEHAGL